MNETEAANVSNVTVLAAVTGWVTAATAAATVTTGSTRGSLSVDTSLPGMFSSNGFWESLKFTSDSCANLLVRLARILSTVMSSSPSLLKIVAGLGLVLITVPDVLDLGVVCDAFLSASGFFLGCNGRYGFLGLVGVEKAVTSPSCYYSLSDHRWWRSISVELWHNKIWMPMVC